MKLSVVITSYNQRDYLVQAIESVVGQTVKPHEIIVADDLSSDGSRVAIQGFMARYPDLVKGLFQEQNLGISENRNAGLRMASGDHVAVLDGDDRYLPDNLERQVQALHECPRARCAYSNLYFVDPQGTRKRIRDAVVQPNGDILAHIAQGQMGVMRSMIMPLDLVREAGYFDPRFPKHDGYVLSLRLAKMAEYAYVFEPTAEYRVHASGDSKTYTYRPRVGYLTDVWTEVEGLIQDLPPSAQTEIRRTWYYRLLRTQVMADLEEGKKARAALRAAAGLARTPHILTRLPRVMLRSLGSAPGGSPENLAGDSQ